VNWEFETKNCFFPFSLSKGSKKFVAKASRRIEALVSGDAARRLETVFLGRRRLSGMRDWVAGAGSPSSESMSREERPRWAVRYLAAVRMEVGVRYGKGKDWRVEYIGRVMA
jgi:hypothetical protein